MKAVSWNDGWTVKHLDETGEGTPVRIPHDAMLGEKKSADALGGTNTGWYEGYDYLYEKDFIPGDEYKNKKMILEFEGVYHEAEVWINDKKAAFRPYGYTNFYVDVTELMGSEILLYLIANRVVVDEELASKKNMVIDRSGEQKLTARVSPRSTARNGDTITVAIDTARMHLFDKETEKRIVFKSELPEEE